MKLTASSTTALALGLATLTSAAPHREIHGSSSPRNLHLHLHRRGTDAPYGIKKGLAYNDGEAIKTLSQSNSATWAYNWGTASDATQFQQIPMHWGLRHEGDKEGIHAMISAGNSPWVLGYNEPDVSRSHGGCEASPEDAYAAWGADMFQFADRGARLVCPAVSSWDTEHGHTGGPSGLTWLARFLSLGPERGGPGQFRCEAQALHWYGVEGLSGGEQAGLFIEYVERAHDKVDELFGRPMDLWITEFAPLPVRNAEVMAEFLRVAQPFLDGADYVARYSPFMAETMVNGGQLNTAGQVFVAGH